MRLIMGTPLRLRAVIIDRLGPFRRRANVRFGSGLTFLIGPNGSGKTTLLKAILRVREAAERHPDWTTKREVPIYAEPRWSLMVAAVKDLNVLGFNPFRWDAVSGGFENIRFEAPPHDATAEGLIAVAFDELPGDGRLSTLLRFVRYVDPIPTPVAEGGIEGRDDVDDRVGAWTSRDFAKSDAVLRENISESLRYIAPQVERIEAFNGHGRAFSNFVVEGKELTGPMMSTGTLRAFAILTALETSPDGSLLLIEEPDAFIDPNAMGVVLDSLIANSDRLQIIASTHSPDLLQDDRIRADMIRVLHRGPDGSSIHELPEHLARAIDNETYTAGALLGSGALSEGAW